MGIADDAAERAEDGMISARSQRSVEAWGHKLVVPLTPNGHHKVFCLDSDRRRIEQQTVFCLVYLRVPALDCIECGFRAQGLIVEHGQTSRIYEG